MRFRKLKNSSFLSSIIILLFLFTACQFSTANYSQQMEELVKTSQLTIPEDTILVTQKEGIDQGSQDGCYTVYVERLYGTQQPFDQVRLFYEQMLTADGWEKNTVLSDVTYARFDRTDGFVLGVYDKETASRISRRQIEDARQKYATVYLVSAVYATPETWKQCGQHVEDNN
jgi:hypothetical protein